MAIWTWNSSRNSRRYASGSQFGKKWSRCSITARCRPRKVASSPSCNESNFATGMRGYLDAEARANAGDPGPVVLRD